MKTNVTFDSAGLTIAGHLYTPDNGATGPRPAIVVGRPASGVKEQTAGLYAARLARDGFIALAFDAAHQGEIEGTPRDREDPHSVSRTSSPPSPFSACATTLTPTI